MCRRVEGIGVKITKQRVQETGATLSECIPGKQEMQQPGSPN